ncbi:MAG: hypothetical protein IKS10_06150 [Lachnospiraceae bacterium]|nr:hypothetical protein [Lachnospiraceae bacterium]
MSIASNEPLLTLAGDGLYSNYTTRAHLAQKVNYQYIDTYAHEREYIADDFNTFYSAMIDEYNGCFGEDTSGGLNLSIHILNGSIDKITIQVDQYP